jgi:hypothetical protein
LNDEILNLLARVANNDSKPNARITLFMSGQIVTGLVSPAASVIQDILVGLDIDEEESRIFANTPEKQGEGIINLTDVSIYMAGQACEVPFLRVAINRVDAWVSGVDVALR